MLQGRCVAPSPCLLLCGVVVVFGGCIWLVVGSLTAEAEIVRMKRERLGNLHSIIALRQVVRDNRAVEAQAVSGDEFLQGASEARHQGPIFRAD